MDRLLGLDFLVEQRLGEHRLVTLVMAVLAIAPHVDDDVVLEGLPVFESQGGDKGAGFRIVAIHVKDGGLDHLGDVGAVLAAV